MNFFSSLRRVSPAILVPMFVLIILGLSFVYSTTGGAHRFFLRQLAWSGIGLATFFVCLRTSYRNLLNWSPVLYVAATLLLLAVLLFGKSRGISQSWLALGPFTLQPSEFAKLVLVLAIAHYLGADPQSGGWRIVGKVFLWAFLPVLLVLAQPDLGTTLVFGPMLLALLWIAGAKGKQICLLVATGLAFLPIGFHFLKEYQKDRLMVFLNPDADPLGAGYNIIQSKIAIGSGGFLGKGFGLGTQNRLKFLPERHTDFIFSIVAEEIGWWGGMLVLLLFVMMLVSALRIAQRAPDMQGKLLVIGLTVMLFAHVFINVGVSLGLMPVTGLPLPFVSYGGSSLVTCMAAVALIVNVGSRRFPAG